MLMDILILLVKSVLLAFLIGGGAIVLATLSAEKYHRRRKMGGIDIIDEHMTKDQFGVFLAALFRQTGAVVEKPAVHAFEGEASELIVEEAQGRTYVVGLKTRDGVHRETIDRMCEQAVFLGVQRQRLVTNSMLSREAERRAKEFRIEVWDRLQIIRRFAKISGRALALDIVGKGGQDAHSVMSGE